MILFFVDFNFCSREKLKSTVSEKINLFFYLSPKKMSCTGTIFPLLLWVAFACDHLRSPDHPKCFLLWITTHHHRWGLICTCHEWGFTCLDLGAVHIHFLITLGGHNENVNTFWSNHALVFWWPPFEPPDGHVSIG